MGSGPSPSKPAARFISTPATTKTSTVRIQSSSKLSQPFPDKTVIDGEVVALDDSGRPSFSALQNYGSAQTPIVYYVFDLMAWKALTSCGSSSLVGANCWS